MKWERRKNRTLSRKQKYIYIYTYSASEINKLIVSQRKTIPIVKVTLEIKVSRESRGTGTREEAGDVHRPVREAQAHPGPAGADWAPERPGHQLRLYLLPLRWTTPKDATANIFFINIFYFLFLD